MVIILKYLCYVYLFSFQIVLNYLVLSYSKIVIEKFSVKFGLRHSAS